MAAKTNTLDKRELLARFAAPTVSVSLKQRNRALAREKIALGAINAGRNPNTTRDPDELKSLFSPEELDLLVAAAEATAAEKDARSDAVEQRRTLKAAMKFIEQERERERQADLEAEARKLLNWPATGLPKNA